MDNPLNERTSVELRAVSSPCYPVQLQLIQPITISITSCVSDHSFKRSRKCLRQGYLCSFVSKLLILLFSGRADLDICIISLRIVHIVHTLVHRLYLLRKQHTLCTPVTCYEILKK